MLNNKYNASTEYKKAIRLLNNCGCSKIIPRERFVELREAFQALSRSEQDVFLMAQLKAMNDGEITASRRLKGKTRTNKRTFTTEIAIRRLSENVSVIGRIHLENI